VELVRRSLFEDPTSTTTWLPVTADAFEQTCRQVHDAGFVRGSLKPFRVEDIKGDLSGN
jgi:hypothetical protein